MYDKKQDLKNIAMLHDDLRNYGNIKDIDKPLIVSGILLALRESEKGNFSINNLTGDTIETDGEKIYDAISISISECGVSSKILNQFTFIKDTQILNKINPKLNKTPLKYFTEFLNDKIYQNITNTNSSEDYLGRFYGEFMSYSGGDGQTLGIVLTPKHIVDLFCELVDIKNTDVVLDPCCGTGSFLVGAMHHMLKQVDKTDVDKIKNIKQNQLYGIELQSYMFTIATVNMILRCGKSNIINEDFLKQNQNQFKKATVGMINPPYSQGSKQNPELYEIAFIEHLLNSLTKGARAIAIVPQSTMTGKTKDEKLIKKNILKKHTLEGVITLNKDTFYGVGVMPCIAVFTTGEPHPENKKVKFIDFQDDGYKVSPHIGLLETEQAKDKKQHLLDVWFNRVNFESKFCVETTIEATDEWLHSFYYFNDEIPTEEDFEKTVGDYMIFEFSMIMQGREYLFTDDVSNKEREKVMLTDRNWFEFKIEDLFDVTGSKTTKLSELIASNQENIEYPYITTKATNNGVDGFYKFKTENRNVIVFDSATNGYLSYQGYDFSASDHVEIMKPRNFVLNKYIALFIITTINKSINGKFSYGFKLSQSRMKKQKILLPTKKDDENTPDWLFMEQYIKEIEKTKREMYFTYTKNINL